MYNVHTGSFLNLQHIPDLLPVHQIITVSIYDVFASGNPVCRISGCCLSLILLVDHHNSVILFPVLITDALRAIGTAIIHQYDLQVLIGLIQHTVHCCPNIFL